MAALAQKVASLEILVTQLQTENKELIALNLTLKQQMVNQLEEVEAMHNVMERDRKAQSICCNKGHVLKLRTTPKTRYLFVAGNNIHCDICKTKNLDIEHGYYTCESSCNYDVCRDCFFDLVTNQKDEGTSRGATLSFRKNIAMQKEAIASFLNLSKPLKPSDVIREISQQAVKLGENA